VEIVDSLKLIVNQSLGQESEYWVINFWYYVA
jgi:hypothetical protein